MIEITNELVRQLVDSQFPKWKGLTITPVEKAGTITAPIDWETK